MVFSKGFTFNRLPNLVFLPEKNFSVITNAGRFKNAVPLDKLAVQRNYSCFFQQALPLFSFKTLFAESFL
jgi:hypothetical protein